MSGEIFEVASKGNEIGFDIIVNAHVLISGATGDIQMLTMGDNKIIGGICHRFTHGGC